MKEFTRIAIENVLEEIKNSGNEVFEKEELKNIVDNNYISFPTFKKYVNIEPINKKMEVSLDDVVDILNDISTGYSEYSASDFDYDRFKVENNRIYRIHTTYRVCGWK